MKKENNVTMLEQLYVTKTISSNELEQYALALGVSCKKLNNFIVSEQYQNNLNVRNIFKKILTYGLYSNLDMEQFYEIISSCKELEYLCSSLDYEHPNLKRDPMRFIDGIDKIKDESLDEFDLYDDSKKGLINIYNENTKKIIILLAHRTGISTKKLARMLNKNYEEIYGIIGRIIKPQISSINHLQDNASLLKNIDHLAYKISSLNYNYPKYCENNFQLINAILNYNESDLLKFDNKTVEDERLKNFVLAKKIGRN